MKEFKLSATLYGHSMDVRSLSIASDDCIISGSRDRTAKYWKANPINTIYTDAMTYRGHENFVASVLYLEPTSSYPEGLVITGGNDKKIRIYRPSEPFAEMTLLGHENVVCCLSKGLQPNTFYSSSWDKNVMFWDFTRSTNASQVFAGHAAAVWSVLQRSDKCIVTASADKTVRIWSDDGLEKKVLEGHTDCVRGLEDFPELNCFMSVSNDATIRVWSYLGETLNIYYGHTNYIYSIARCKFGGENCFVTSDEDYSVRFWQNGENTDTIKLPAQSVWCVACLSNGDVVTGSSDGLLRIFTKDPGRVADEPTLAKYEEEVSACQRQSLQEIGGVKVSDLPGKEALYAPGTKAGQMKMVREPQGVVAYTWVEDGLNSHWEKVGDVLGGTDKDNDGKTTFNNQSYDFVFNIDVEDGKPALKLPYNKSDDPYTAANEFLSKNNLPSSYLEQVVNFIIENSGGNAQVQSSGEYVDPFTGASRYTPQTRNNESFSSGTNLDPFTGASSYSTGVKTPQNPVPLDGRSSFFPQTTYRFFDMGDPKIILTKLIEFNQKCGDGHSGVDINENSLKEVVKLCSSPPTDANSIDLLFKLLEWPDDVVFPVLDVVRLAVRHEKNNEIISNMNNGSLLEKIKGYISENCKIVNNTIVALRTLSNLLSHAYGEQLVLENRFDILECITSLSCLNKNAEVGVATLLLNITVGVIKTYDDMGLSVLADVIPEILTTLRDPESQFRAYVSLGTLLCSPFASQTAELRLKVKTNSTFICKLEEHLTECRNDLEKKRAVCAAQVKSLL